MTCSICLPWAGAGVAPASPLPEQVPFLPRDRGRRCRGTASRIGTLKPATAADLAGAARASSGGPTKLDRPCRAGQRRSRAGRAQRGSGGTMPGGGSTHERDDSDRCRSLQRHGDPADAGDAPVHVRRRGGRRAEGRGPDGEPPPGDGRGAPRQGGGGLPPLGHHVQRDRDARALPAGRRDAGPPDGASHPLRDRRARGARRRQRAPARRRRAGSSTPRPCTRACVPQPLRPAEPAALGRADEQSRRRQRSGRSSGSSAWSTRGGATASPRTWTAPAS